MSERSFRIDTALSKEQRYEEFISLFKSLLSSDDESLSILCNACAAMKEAFEHLWIGFYLVKGGQLMLGPFQGGLACSPIRKGRGVCGQAWLQEKSIIVADVEQFPGHIACSSLSRSEIVIPIKTKEGICGVLDIDSSETNTFDAVDQHYLEEIASLLSSHVLNLGNKLYSDN